MPAVGVDTHSIIPFSESLWKLHEPKWGGSIGLAA
jgi:hypothetical protein